MRAKETLVEILKAWRLFKSTQTKRDSHIDLRERDPGYSFNITVTQVNQYFPWYNEYASIVGRFYERRLGGENIADVCPQRMDKHAYY